MAEDNRFPEVPKRPEEIQEALRASEKKKSKDGFRDPSNNYPTEEHKDTSSVNKAARGISTNELYIGGGSADLNLELKELGYSEYSMSQVKESVSGHVTETDDTPNNERLLFKHKSGTGIDMRADGTIIVSSKNNTVQICGADHKVLIEGDGEIHYLGNLTLHVAGDMDVDVKGNYNLRVHGDKKEEIFGGSSTKIVENKSETVVGNSSTFVSKASTETYLNDRNIVVKNNNKERIAGKHELFIGSEATITAPDEFNISSNSINIGAKDLSLVSASGIIGGSEVMYYGKNFYGTSATFTAGVTAPTFHGDLDGTAYKSILADVTNSQNYGENVTGTAQGWSIQNVATDTAVRTISDTEIAAPGPNEALMEQYLSQSDNGIRNVQVDPGGVMQKTIDKSSYYGGVSNRTLTTEMVRSKLRDPNTARNKTFIARAIAEGVLHPSYINQKPEKFQIGMIYNQDGTGKLPAGKLLGNEKENLERVAVDGNAIITRTLIPNQLYNPELQYMKFGVINGKTKLAAGTSLSKFLGGYGDPVTLDHITDDIERLKIARNLYAQAEFRNSAQEFLDKTNSHRLVVIEGLYKKGAEEKLDPDSLNYLASRGQVIVYEVRDRNGKIDIDYTFQLAVHIKDYINFDKMILDYDSYNPDGSLNAQLIIQMPPVNADWSMRYRNKIETRFNNYTQTNGELVEIIEPDEETSDDRKTTPTIASPGPSKRGGKRAWTDAEAKRVEDFLAVTKTFGSGASQKIKFNTAGERAYAIARGYIKP